MMSAKLLAGLPLSVAAILVPLAPMPAMAHCDTLDGPVVTEARVALETGDVTRSLKWVGPEYEGEVRAAFDHALQVRKLSDPARELADTFFFETLVRIHRAGEGAPYSGLKPMGAEHPAESAADAALASGTVDGLTGRIADHASDGVRRRFAAVLEKRKHADDSVEAGRAYVSAYVDYVHYVLGLHTAIEAAGHHDQPHSGH